jgi:hypothetical protein
MLEPIVARIAGATAVYRLTASRGVRAARQGPLVLVDQHVGRARLRCSESHADAAGRCLRRQAWLLETVAHAGGTRATVREDRCMCAGGPACEYVVSWTARPRVMLVVAAAILVAVGIGGAVQRGALPYAAWGLLPVAAIAVHAAERRRSARSVTTSLVESGAAFGWLLAQAVAARSRATAAVAVSEPVSAQRGVAAEPERRHPGTPLLTQEGELWRIEYQGQVVMLRHSRGLALLAHLVRSPGRPIHVRDLDAMTPSGGSALPRPEATDGDFVPVPADAVEVLDRQALAEYRRRMGELRAEIEDAASDGDSARVEHLRSAVGTGGRARRVPPEVERLRTAITRRIRSAIVKIAEHHAKLGAHLEAHISTGYTCAYEPADTPDSTRDRH